MVTDLDKGHNTDDCKIMKRYIEALIQKDLLKNFMDKRRRRPSPPRRDCRASPKVRERIQEAPRAKKVTLNVINVASPLEDIPVALEKATLPKSQALLRPESDQGQRMR